MFDDALGGSTIVDLFSRVTDQGASQAGGEHEPVWLKISSNRRVDRFESVNVFVVVLVVVVLVGKRVEPSTTPIISATTITDHIADFLIAL